MLSAIRRNQYSLTFFIVLLTIISFIWLYNRTNLSQVGVNDVATIYGHVLQRADIEREARDYRLAMALGLTDLVRDMGGFVENEEVALSSFIFNILVLQQEAASLQIVPTEKEIAAAIEKVPLFQTEGIFDSEKYARVMKEELAPRGLTERQLEEVMRDSLALKKIREVIISPVVISDAQIREAARIYQPLQGQAVFFNLSSYLSSEKKKEITAEEKKSFYEKNQKSFVSNEERAVNYCVVELTSEQQKMETKERVRAMQSLSDRLSALKQKAQGLPQSETNIEKVAAESGLKIIKTSLFNKQGEGVVELTTPSKEEKKKPEQLPQELVEAAFKLANVGDVSEIIQRGSSFYLLTLAQVVPARALSFGEVEKNIEQLLYKEKATQAMNEDAAKSLQKIREAMTAGKSFSEAVALAGCKLESLPAGITPEKVNASLQLSPEQKEAMMATLPLQAGELGELKHTSWGDFAVYLQERTSLFAADWEKHHEEIEASFLQQERELLFFEWMRKARDNAKITVLNGRHHRSLLQTIFGK